MNKSDKWDKFYQNEGEGPWKNADYSLSYILKSLKPGKVLDLGCGTGLNSTVIRNAGFDVTGIDISKTAINSAKKNKGIKFVTGSSFNLPFDTHTFNYVVDYGCLHSTNGKESKHMKNVWNVLKPDGIYILRVFSNKHPLKDTYELFRKLSLTFYTKQKIERLIKQYFKISNSGPDFEQTGKNNNFHLLVLQPREKAKLLSKFKLPKFNFSLKKKPKPVKEIAVYQESKYPADRVYIGSEFCPQIVPKIVKYEKPVTLMTSFIPECYLDNWITILKQFAKLNPDSEVVINDWGLLDIVNELKLKPVLGRLLVRQKTGPKTICIKTKIPKKAYQYFQGCALNSQQFQNFLLNNNIKRAELSNTLQGIYIQNKKLKLSLHTPQVPITVTRACMLAGSTNLSNRRIVRLSDCKLECNPRLLELEDYSMPPKLFLKGNTHYYINEKLPNLEKLGIDRVVYNQ